MSMLSLMFALPAAKIFHGHVRQTRPVEALEFVTGVRPEHALVVRILIKGSSPPDSQACVKLATAPP